MIVATEAGALGDYNHYRSVALQSTVNRSISILTTDVNSYVRNLDGGYFATIGYRDGDLGENILVDGVDFTYFQVGIQYRFSSSSSSVGNPTTEDVVVEITEKIEPCMNLCKLSYFKSEGRCKYLIEALAAEDGLRGWYAKDIQGGIILVGGFFIDCHHYGMSKIKRSPTYLSYRFISIVMQGQSKKMLLAE